MSRTVDGLLEGFHGDSAYSNLMGPSRSTSARGASGRRLIHDRPAESPGPILSGTKGHVPDVQRPPAGGLNPPRPLYNKEARCGGTQEPRAR
ncbi:MAG: hypothetical protein MZV64_43685 [Ignavibacteriales bacterium]|nr:hypothetical protein [Ignavibacteriales bacterium]